MKCAHFERSLPGMVILCFDEKVVFSDYKILQLSHRQSRGFQIPTVMMHVTFKTHAISNRESKE